MIYSVTQHREIPVTVSKKTFFVDDMSDEIMTRYTVCDVFEKSKEIGYVDLEDTKNGVKVYYIKNECPKQYKHFGQIADQIELEHCMKRGLYNPYIQSVAARNTYVKHFKRGKRFLDEGANLYLEQLTKNLLKGKRVKAHFLGYQKMYMPMDMINEIKEKIKIAPLLNLIK